MRFWLYTVVIIHLILIVVNIVSLLILPFFTPWYIAIPLMTFIVRATFSRDRCILTDLENSIRKSMGLKEIRFIKNYIMQPSKKMIMFIKEKNKWK